MQCAGRQCLRQGTGSTRVKLSKHQEVVLVGDSSFEWENALSERVACRPWGATPPV